MTVYYTQLIFIREEQEEVFHRFEDQVLPLLKKYDGKLLYRARPKIADVVESAVGRPYEIHLLSFESKEGFEGYSRDPQRQKLLPLKEEAVATVMLIEGVMI